MVGASAGRGLSATWRHRWPWVLAVLGAIVALAVAASLRRAGQDAGNPLADLTFLQLTDFEGIEQAAAISRGGHLAGAEREGQVGAELRRDPELARPRDNGLGADVPER